MNRVFDIDVLVFDLDGTLTDSAAGIVDAANHIRQTLGLGEKPAADIISYVGTGLYELIQKTIESDDPTAVREATALYQRYYQSVSLPRTPLFPGVREMLEHFKEKVLAVVSNKSRISIDKLLAAHNIQGFFRYVVSGDDPECKKPDPCAFRQIIEPEGVAPEHVLMVGDMVIDVLAGKNIGARTCAVLYGMGNREDIVRCQPDIIIEKIDELRMHVR